MKWKAVYIHCHRDELVCMLYIYASTVIYIILLLTAKFRTKQMQQGMVSRKRS